MKTFWKRNKYLVLTVLGLIFVLILYHGFFYRLFRDKRDAEDDRLFEVEKELGQYFSDPYAKNAKKVPMDFYLETLEKRVTLKKQSVKKLEQVLCLKPTKEFIITKDEKYPGSYFKKILDRKRTALLQESSRRNVEIPEDLGFGEEIPPDEKASDLLRFLYIKDQLILMGLDAGIKQVYSIDHFEDVSTGPRKDLRFIKEYPVKMKIRADLGTAMELLYKLRDRKRFLILRNLEIRSDNKSYKEKNTEFKITIDVAGMKFRDVDEKKFIKKEKPEEKERKRTGQPLGI